MSPTMIKEILGAGVAVGSGVGISVGVGVLIGMMDIVVSVVFDAGITDTLASALGICVTVGTCPGTSAIFCSCSVLVSCKAQPVKIKHKHRCYKPTT